jgi:Gram-negative bacterial TonB protein C-terminal
VMVKSLTFLAFMSACIAVPAKAEQFDLDCRRPATSEFDINIPELHLQIDLEQLKWCRDRCGEIFSISRTDVDPIVLDENNDFNQRNALYFELMSNTLTDIFDFQGDFERVTRLSCERQEFGRFRPYLYEPARLRNANVLLDAFSPINLPEGLVRPAADGSVRFALYVSPQGEVVSCEVRISSGNVDLDKFTCDVMMGLELRFTPAKDRNGNTIASYHERVAVFRGWAN